MSTTGRRRCRRQRGLHNWRLVRYADDFVVLVTGPRADVEALHEQIAVVLATMGLRMSQTKTQVVNMSEGFDYLGFRILWKRKRGSRRRHVYTFIGDRPIRSVRVKVRALTRRTSQQDPEAAFTRLGQV